MNRNVVGIFSIVLILIISACTTYQPYKETPTGDVVVEPEDGINEEAGDVTGEVEGSVEDDIIEIDELLNKTWTEEIEGGKEEPGEEAEEGTEGETAIPSEEVASNETKAEAETAEVEKETMSKPIIEVLGEKADVVAFEGDLIDLKPYVMDPDGDEVSLGFTMPFSQEGIWQTETGDAGFYSVIVTATDNKDSFVTKQMTINVLVKNKPPQISVPDVLEFDEGQLVDLDPRVVDEDGDSVTVSYSGWMAERKYQTTFADAGTYTVTIKADDNKVAVSKDVTVIINDVNREPELIVLSGAKVEVTEGNLVKIEARTTDPDSDVVTVSYSEPFSESGEWQTKEGDEGSYVVELSATDGSNNVTQEVLVEVVKKNSPPVIESVKAVPESVILKGPGDRVTVKIDVVASDPDKNELTYTYSGFMDSAEKTVSYGEKGGLKTVTVTVSDGKDSVSQNVTFNMNNWPCFDCKVG